MITFYTDIFSSHHNYDQIIIDFLQSHTNVELKKSNDWMTHILDAHEIWLDRIRNPVSHYQSYSTPPGNDYSGYTQSWNGATGNGLYTR